MSLKKTTFSDMVTPHFKSRGLEPSSQFPKGSLSCPEMYFRFSGQDVVLINTYQYNQVDAILHHLKQNTTVVLFCPELFYNQFYKCLHDMTHLLLQLRDTKLEEGNQLCLFDCC